MRAVVQRVKSRGDSNLVLIDLAAGKEELLTPHEPPGAFGLLLLIESLAGLWFLSAWLFGKAAREA